MGGKRGARLRAGLDGHNVWTDCWLQTGILWQAVEETEENASGVPLTPSWVQWWPVPFVLVPF